jgi:hypothetical protein
MFCKARKKNEDLNPFLKIFFMLLNTFPPTSPSLAKGDLRFRMFFQRLRRGYRAKRRRGKA